MILFSMTYQFLLPNHEIKKATFYYFLWVFLKNKGAWLHYSINSGNMFYYHTVH